MERKLKPFTAAETLRKRGVLLFSPEEFRRHFGVTLRAAQEFIKDHRGDLFLKLRNGLYALRNAPPHELAIANRLYQPSYVSLEYALAYYRVIPEMVYTVTSVTPSLTRRFFVDGRGYEYSRIKKEAYTGYRLVSAGGSRVLMATPEKALADYGYFMDLKLKSLNERWRVKGLTAKSVLRYARLFHRPSLVRLLEEIL